MEEWWGNEAADGEERVAGRSQGKVRGSTWQEYTAGVGAKQKRAEAGEEGWVPVVNLNSPHIAIGRVRGGRGRSCFCSLSRSSFLSLLYLFLSLSRSLLFRTRVSSGSPLRGPIVDRFFLPHPQLSSVSISCSSLFSSLSPSSSSPHTPSPVSSPSSASSVP